MKHPCVYILASGYDRTLYIGVTSNLAMRIQQHKDHATKGFTDRYDVDILVWYEQHVTMASAIAREKALKRWKRAWKKRLIEETNGSWRDLFPDVLG